MPGMTRDRLKGLYGRDGRVQMWRPVSPGQQGTNAEASVPGMPGDSYDSMPGMPGVFYH